VIAVDEENLAVTHGPAQLTAGFVVGGDGVADCGRTMLWRTDVRYEGPVQQPQPVRDRVVDEADVVDPGKWS
jgi:hypothetical protein